MLSFDVGRWKFDVGSSSLKSLSLLIKRYQISLKGNLLLPIHWGTFNIGIHAWTDPIERMIKTATEKSVKFAAPMHGQPVSIEQSLTFLLSQFLNKLEFIN